ncbi:hypothetical protein BC938DRAFT_482215 [Jimgerdemannia flammicorona]|uniref:DNA mismatch repair protein PMS1 n=1 Tax=Jimgerdemannia flammicorona TaxID=994334 RepID=A0A433QEX1_9FUNG|nr:hypothetical protein BC938DRAFT_482215 [Jimgerdemannia flammicorona]
MTANSIVRIDKASVHRICSGQVVLDLATTVKELVENSLDAKATSVEIRFKEYGLESLEVIDNGTGIEPHNFETLALKHYTSKLSNFEDLAEIASFGFRGEALSSLCALSKLTVTTRTKDQRPAGVRLEYDTNGHLISKLPAPREPGTSVHLQDLFHSLPVRHCEFKKNLKREYARALALVQAYAIISEGVRIVCTNQTGKSEKSTALSTNCNRTIRDNIANIFGTKLTSQLMPVDILLKSSGDGTKIGFSIVGGDDRNDFKSELQDVNQGINDREMRITGFITKPNWGGGRSSTDRQYYYINGRPCVLPKVARIVNEVYHSFISNQYPFVVADLRLPRDAYDVNVSPDKRTIFLHDEKRIVEALTEELSALFEPSRSTFAIGSMKPKLKAHDLKRRASSLGEDVGEQENDVKETSLVSDDISSAENFATISPSWNNGTLASSSSSASPPMSVEREENGPCTLSFKATEEIGDDALSSLRATAADDLQTKPFSSLNRLRSFTPLTTAAMPFKMRSISDSMETISSRKEKKLKFGKPPSSSTNIVKLSAVRRAEDCTTGFGNDIDDEEEQFLINSRSQRRRQQKKVDDENLKYDCELEEAGDSRIDDKGGEQKEVTKIPPHVAAAANPKAPEFAEIEMDSLQTRSGERDSMTVAFDANCSRIEQRLQMLRPRLIDQIMVPMVGGHLAAASVTTMDNDKAVHELSRVIDKHSFAAMSVLGQFNLGFIITKLDRENGKGTGDLYIVDQHASDEKYNFEILQKATKMHSQRLIRPRCPELTAAEELTAIENIEILRANGFEIEVDPDAEPTKRIKIVSQPMSKCTLFDMKDFEELVFLLIDRPGEMVRCSRARAMFASRACRKSVMIGDCLSKVQMRKIIEHMGEMDQPWNCPHGRPTMRHLCDLSAVAGRGAMARGLRGLSGRGSLWKSAVTRSHGSHV